MKVNITARKFKAHDSLKEFIIDEVNGIERYYDEVMSADVILSFLNTPNSVKTAEIILQIPGQVITASESSDDYKKAIPAAVEKINRQLEKNKTKKITVRTNND